jgi:hypothetical protein
MTEPRGPQQRKQDTLARLGNDVDAWIATAEGDTPYLVPLSFLWNGETLLISTAADSPAGRNLRTTGKIRLGLGLTRDVVRIEGTAETTEVDHETGDAFAEKTGFDPRELPGYLYFRVQPRRVQAWREVNELKGRTLMRDGNWVSEQP